MVRIPRHVCKSPTGGFALASSDAYVASAAAVISAPVAASVIGDCAFVLLATFASSDALVTGVLVVSIALAFDVNKVVIAGAVFLLQAVPGARGAFLKSVLGALCCCICSSMI